MRIKITLCLFVMCSFMSLNAHGQNKTFNISGKVIDSMTNKPISGVYITMGKEGGQTNINGIYSIKNVPEGEITLGTMYYNTYTQKFVNINLKSDTTVNFNLNNILVMDEVVVTGTRTEKYLSEAPVLTSVISSNAIRAAASTSSLESLMDNIPGIVVSKNAMGSNLRIKGLNSRYILFLIDGERMVSEGAGGNINLDQIDVNTIQRIEMINGASSALYGSNAVGAVINIITKEPTHKFQGSANVIGESNSTLRTGINAGVNLKKVKATVSGFRNSSNGFERVLKEETTTEEEQKVSASKYTDYGANMKVTYKPVERADISVLGRYFTHETFNPEASTSVVHTLTQNINIGANGGFESRNKLNDFRASVNFNLFTDYNVFEKLSNKKEKDNEASYISSRAINTFSPNEKWEIIGGVEYNHESNFATTTLGAEPTTKSLDDMNVFAQAEHEVLKNFDIVGGARYTYNTQFGSSFNPKLSLMYELKDFKFRGGIGTAFRTPSIKELYYDFNHSGMFWIHGNPNLKAENGLYSSLSVEYDKNYTNISVSGHWNDIKNKISQYTVVDASGFSNRYYENVDRATLKGFDVSIAQTFFRQLTLKANYSFSDAKNVATGLQLSSNVKHSGTTSLTWNGKVWRSPFSLQISGMVNSPRLYQSIETDAGGVETTTFDESKVYSIWKVALVKPFRINKHTIEITAKVDNIFGFKDASYVNSGTMYLLGIRYYFK